MNLQEEMEKFLNEENEKFKKGDIVKSLLNGIIYEVFNIKGTTVQVAEYYGNNKYGSLINIHSTKIKKVSK